MLTLKISLAVGFASTLYFLLLLISSYNTNFTITHSFNYYGEAYIEAIVLLIGVICQFMSLLMIVASERAKTQLKPLESTSRLKTHHTQ